MCVAYPGRVVSIIGTHGMVDFSGTEVPVNLSMVPAKIGDYVLVHAGMAIQIVGKRKPMIGLTCLKKSRSWKMNERKRTGPLPLHL